MMSRYGWGKCQLAKASHANAHADNGVAKHVPDLRLTPKLSLICHYGHTALRESWAPAWCRRQLWQVPGRPQRSHQPRAQRGRENTPELQITTEGNSPWHLEIPAEMFSHCDVPPSSDFNITNPHTIEESRHILTDDHTKTHVKNWLEHIK